jgi:hypothetical protein
MKLLVIASFALLIGQGFVHGTVAAATPAAAAPAPVEKTAERWVALRPEDWDRRASKPVTSTEVDALLRQELAACGHRSAAAARTTDEQFIRRVSLDLTGRLPGSADIAQFTASTDPAKRSRLIDRLLADYAFARHWARYWRDVVTARITNRRSMGLTRSFEEWLYEQLRANRSWEEITRAILTAEGELRFTLNQPSAENGALFFLVAHDADEAEERAAETSRVFLGIQIQCAQCHNHFTEKWTREQFHEFAAYFARTKFDQLFIDKKLSGVQLLTLPDREHKVAGLADPEMTSIAHPRFLDGQSPGVGLTDRDRREALADTIVSKKNPWFAAAHVNRVWSELMGRSFYRHVDDLGPRKEVIFPEVLTALTGSFQASDYDIKALFRVILNTDAYQAQLGRDEPAAGAPAGSVATTPGSTAPSGFAATTPGNTALPFAAAASRRLRADTLWDSLVHVLGKLEPGARFHTGGGVRFNSSFLEGRFRAEFDFDPSTDPEEVNGTIPQTLFLMNNQVLNEKIQVTKTSALGRILRDHPADADALEQVYLLALARKPTDRETTRCKDYVAGSSSRAAAFEDILWALFNSTEFQRTR